MKTQNEYADNVPDYTEIPKAVLGAIAFSFALTQSGSSDFKLAQRILITEWDALHTNHIVPQKVPGTLRHYILTPEEQLR